MAERLGFHFKWEPKSGCFIPHQDLTINDDPLPWEAG